MTIWTSKDNVWSAHRSYLNQVWPDVFRIVALLSLLLYLPFFICLLLFCKTHFESIWERGLDPYILEIHLSMFCVQNFEVCNIWQSQLIENRIWDEQACLSLFRIVTKKSKATALSSIHRLTHLDSIAVPLFTNSE